MSKNTIRKSLKIMAWNANGILKHKNELELVLNQKRIDICLVSETHLTTQMYSTFNGFNMYCSNHPLNNARGGSAIIIKNSIEHFEEEKISSTEFQATTVGIKFCNYQLSVTAVYSPPRHNIKSTEYTQLLNKHKGRFVIGGDFNAKLTNWGSRLTTTKGRELWKAAQQCGCEIFSTGNPTYWPTDINKSPDLIDFFVVKQLPYNSITLEDDLDLNSDHSPIFMILDGEPKINESNLPLSNKYTDWQYFKTKLDTYVNTTNEIDNVDEIEKETIKLSAQIQKAAWLSTPVRVQKINRQRYPSNIIELIKEKRKIRKKWQSIRSPSLKTQLNNLTKTVKYAIQENKNRTLNIKLQNLTADKTSDYSLWRTMAHMKRPIQHNPPIKQPNSNQAWAKTDSEKAELFAQHLQKIFKPFETINNTLFPYTVQESVEITSFTTDEVANEISKLKQKKSPGFDLITAEVLKNLSHKALIKLTLIMNACIEFKYIPMHWKISEIKMIPKPGKNPNEVTSYRPIALLPVIGKLFEKLFSKRLKNIISNKQLIPSHQFGFREKHSTIDQIHRIVHIIEEAIENNQVCSAIFLDVAQAFDKVWHEGLIRKLRAMLPYQYTVLLESYLTDRYFRVKQRQAYSNIKKIEAGVPQGSILGPVLYLLYTADLPVSNTSKIATFADDTCILAYGNNANESTRKLQASIDEVVAWTENWRIKLNESKSVHVDFTNKKIAYNPVKISSATVPYSNTAKYLGMTLDAKLKWKEHVKMKATEINLKIKKIKWLIGRKSTLSIQNKLLIYNQVVRPVWTYGIQLWGCTTKSNIEAVQRLQNKILRDMVNAPWYVRNHDLHNDLSVKKVADIIPILANKHETRLKEHTNPEATELTKTVCTRRLRRTKPRDLVANTV